MCLRCYKKGWEVGEGIKQTKKSKPNKTRKLTTTTEKNLDHVPQTTLTVIMRFVKEYIMNILKFLAATLLCYTHSCLIS